MLQMPQEVSRAREYCKRSVIEMTNWKGMALLAFLAILLVIYTHSQEPNTTGMRLLIEEPGPIFISGGESKKVPMRFTNTHRITIVSSVTVKLNNCFEIIGSCEEFEVPPGDIKTLLCELHAKNTTDCVGILHDVRLTFKDINGHVFDREVIEIAVPAW
jgi:hypothetical protein